MDCKYCIYYSKKKNKCFISKNLKKCNKYKKLNESFGRCITCLFYNEYNNKCFHTDKKIKNEIEIKKCNYYIDK